MKKEKRTEVISLRMTREELEHLEKCSSSSKTAKFSNGRDNFSEYLRVQLFSGSGYRNKKLEMDVNHVRYELRKIGTNVNQIAKKINSGYGTPTDLKELEQYLARVESVFERFKKEVEDTWRSQN